MTQRNEQLVCVATFMAREGREEELLKELTALMPQTRREEGCIRYELNRSMENPRRFVYIEKFSSDAHFAKHAQAPYVRRLNEQLVPVLAEWLDVHTYREIVPYGS